MRNAPIAGTCGIRHGDNRISVLVMAQHCFMPAVQLLTLQAVVHMRTDKSDILITLLQQMFGQFM